MNNKQKQLLVRDWASIMLTQYANLSECIKKLKAFSKPVGKNVEYTSHIWKFNNRNNLLELNNSDFIV